MIAFLFFVFWGGLNNSASGIKKQIALARGAAWFFIALATAFEGRTAGSFINFGLRAGLSGL